MKNILSLIIVSVLVTVAISACGSSKGNCDAYGSVSTESNSDLASK